MNHKNICAATARHRAIKHLIFGVGSVILALLCRWAMTDFAPPGEGTMVANRYTPFLFLFSAMFAVLALWLFFQGLRDMLVLGSSNVAKSVRGQLTPEELRLPLREQFALVDADLADGIELIGGKMLVGQEWLFAKEVDLPAIRLTNITNLFYQQADHGTLAFCICDQNGTVRTLEGLSFDELGQLQDELMMRLPQWGR